MILRTEVDIDSYLSKEINVWNEIASNYNTIHEKLNISLVKYIRTFVLFVLLITAFLAGLYFLVPDDMKPATVFILVFCLGVMFLYFLIQIIALLKLRVNTVPDVINFSIEDLTSSKLVTDKAKLYYKQVLDFKDILGNRVAGRNETNGGLTVFIHREGELQGYPFTERLCFTEDKSLTADELVFKGTYFEFRKRSLK